LTNVTPVRNPWSSTKLYARTCRVKDCTEYSVSISRGPEKIDRFSFPRSTHTHTIISLTAGIFRNTQHYTHWHHMLHKPIFSCNPHMPQNAPLSWTCPPHQCCRLQTWIGLNHAFCALVRH
jgi:hypothetical protein